LWVGRKTSSADAITVLEGVERALPQLPSAQVVMLFGDDTLLESVEQRVRESALLRAKILLSAHVSLDELPNYYSAADIFVSASEAESSGEALIAAMSAGLVPVVTDMPVFHAIAGECGARFEPRGNDSLAVALVGAWAQDVNATKVATRSRFDRELSWSAIATRTIAEYRSILDARRSRQPTK
jgi:glycosyltransferase involved in cell wall biosynthesis